MPPPALPSPLLLFRHVCLLAAVAGILAWREPAQGLVFFLLLWLFDTPRSANARAVCVLVLAFACGFSYAHFRERDIPAMPDWLVPSVQLLQDPEKGERRPPGIRLEATVAQVVPLHDDRLRIILTDITPARGSAAATDGGLALGNEAVPAHQPPRGMEDMEAAHYDGGLVWTWKEPLFIPLRGTRLRAEFKPLPVRDMANPGTWGVEQYWRDRSVFLRAWSKGEKAGAVVISEEGVSRSSEIRADLRSKFLSALFPAAEPQQAEPARPVPPGASILPALLFGDRSFISLESTDRFARATLAHSLALSGLHLGYAAAAGFALAWLLGRIFPSLLLRMPRQKLALLLAVPLAGGYLWLGQAPVSLARASLMLVFWTALLFLHRPKVILEGLLAAVGVLLLFDPSSLFDISLQLSALSVAVIALTLPAIQAFVHARIPGRGSWASFLRGGLSILCISFCIQLVLMPLTVRTFGTAGVWFPLNLLWLPVLGAWVMPFAFAGLLLAAMELQVAASWCLALASAPGDALFFLLDALDTCGWLEAPVVMRPHWLFMAGFWLFCLLLPGLWRRAENRIAARRKTAHAGDIAATRGESRSRLRFFSLLLCCALFLALPTFWSWQASHRQGVRVYLLDVGQGQSLLVEWGGLTEGVNSEGERMPLPSSGRVLVDGGGFSSPTFDVGEAVVSPALTDNRPARLDAVINSHPDVDHLGGLVYILRHFAVGAYMRNSDAPPPALEALLADALVRRDIPVRVLAAGQTIPLGPQLHLEVLWPPERSAEETGGKSKNSASLVLRLVWQGKPLLLTCGDAEASSLRSLVRSQEALSAQVLVLPHHGSGSSVVPDFYRAVQPDVALASCGYGNMWGFPSPKAWKALHAIEVPVYSTARSGQISLEWHAADARPSLGAARGLQAYKKPQSPLSSRQETE